MSPRTFDPNHPDQKLNGAMFILESKGNSESKCLQNFWDWSISWVSHEANIAAFNAQLNFVFGSGP
jgi:hypothetical protein